MTAMASKWNLHPLDFSLHLLRHRAVIVVFYLFENVLPNEILRKNFFFHFLERLKFNYETQK